MPGALEGIRVIEIAGYISGPYAGMMLGDMGAEVVKVEPPKRGDPFRRWGSGKLSPNFEALNRNKKSVALDLKSDEGKAGALKLLKEADVVIDNNRAGALARLGLDWEMLHELNPRLIYCSITGYGASGPYCDWPGFDTIGQAMGGLLSLLTERDAPQPMGYSFSDHLAGSSAFQGVMGALFARERTGRGQLVETSLMEATVSAIGENATRYFMDDKVPDRALRTHIAQVYACTGRDGLPFVIHMSSPPHFWEELTNVVGHPEWREDPRFSGWKERQDNYDALKTELDAAFAMDDRAVWLKKLRDADVPAGALYNLAEVFRDEQVRHLGMKQDVPHASGQIVPLVRPAVRLSETPLAMRHAAPELGADNDALLGAASDKGH
ncbi:MAG: CaiB/BaiF CoA transferase family protein [Alphaproteobacteria bacterium]